jgi:signal transduction histidine kinase
MSAGSLRLRLLLAAALSIAVALLLAGLALSLIFEDQVYRRVTSELENHFYQLAGGLEPGANGNLTITRPLADPRFELPLSGLYWQVSQSGGSEPLRSKSLWDEGLSLPDASDAQGVMQGPSGVPLYFIRRQITIDADGKEMPITVFVAVDKTEVDTPVSDFRWQILWSLGLIGAALMVAAWAQVSIGLSPLKRLSSLLSAMRRGETRRLEGSFPNEVAPLAGELNALLDAQEKTLDRARARAGDLAHGLKTPLTVLSAIARDIAERGLKKEACEIEEQAELIRLHVERQLARARLASGRTVAATPLKEAADRVVAAMKRSPRGDDIEWVNAIPADAKAAIEKQDLVELFGNLLDNGRKWAKTRVALSFADHALIIEDDGPGVPQADLERIIERGHRLDEKTQGSGLGLAIVRDIAEIYGLDFDLSRSELGGLRIAINLSTAGKAGGRKIVA